jgi:protein-S-isoprenylcysteine O-methyltransferase Ste14
MRRIATVYSLIAVFVTSERFLRQGTAATSLQEVASDAGSTRAIGTALGVSTIALLLAPILNRRRIAILHKRQILFWAGVSAMISGLVLRSWANRVLGAAYTRTLRVVTDQHIIQEGPYRIVRHPGYLGTLLVWLGAALALANGVVVATVGTALVGAYRKRIEAEERMLLDTFDDEYQSYAGRTRRLVPFVY